MRFCEALNCDQPVFGTCKISRKGYCKKHQTLREDFDKRSITQKAVAKRQEGINTKVRSLHTKDNNYKAAEIMHTQEEQWKWFLERRKEMKGVCAHCGQPSCKNDENKFHFSICHILPKAYFPSVATHPDNWIELCFWGKNSCHTNYDNKILDLMDMNCFDQIITKFVKIYPSIAKEEKRRIPAVLMQYLDTET